MDIAKIHVLLNRQKEINIEIQQLNNESIVIGNKLESYFLNTESNKTRSSKRQLLESLGFTVTSKSVNGTQLYVIKDSLIEYRVLFKQSKFHPEATFNAWYTFNEYGIRNRPPVRNFRPLYASKKSTKCENNRPIV